LPTRLPKRSRSDHTPAPLPPDLLPGLVYRGRILLCLDYDGTLAEIASEPGAARPLPQVREVLAALASRPHRVTVAIVTGRSIEALRALLTVPAGIALAGLHGMQIIATDGAYEFSAAAEQCASELAQVRSWVAENVPQSTGFVIEDKGASLALHYRNARASLADRLRREFERFVGEQTSMLKVLHGKMVVEALPKIATKAHAVRSLRAHAAIDAVPVYFGDDLTDEDAFAALGDEGISVLVGSTRASAARYRVDNPAVVVRTLESIVAAANNAPV
jgi:trehalose 6-phosphate phosphatase